MRIGLVVLLLMALAHSASGDEPAATYVGASACEGCHGVEFGRWRGSHHDLAMQEVSPATVLGNFDGPEFTQHGVRSRFFRRDGKYMVRTEGPDGELADYPIRYVFGFQPLQQYLIEFPGGRLQALSLCWDSRPKQQGGQRWFHLYDEPIPAGDALHWTGPNQNWNHMCAECHSTNLRKGYDIDANRFATTWSEIDVGCEACHGPGSRHVAWAKQAAAGDSDAAARSGDLGLALRFESPASRDWSFDAKAKRPRRSTPPPGSLELDTCAPCHSRRIAIAPDEGPGAPLFDTHRPMSLAEGLYFADGQIRDEVYVYGSFVQSAMHAAGVTCSDCHDSHSGRLHAEGNALCSRCHPAASYDTKAHHHHEPGSDGASCVACHMPARTYMQVDPRRDHSLRIPRPDLSDELGSPNACTGCHLGNSNAWAAKAVREWRGGREPEPHWGSAIHAGRVGAADAEARLLEIARDPEVPGIARATAVSLLPRYATDRSGPTLDAALKDPDPLVRSEAVLAIEALAAPEALPALLPSLDDPALVVRLDAARTLAVVPGELMEPEDRAKRDALLEKYREIQRMDGDRAASRLQLASLGVRLEQMDEAERELKAAISLDPTFIPAYVNLADLYRMLGRDVEGEALLRRAVAGDPNNAEAYHALGLVLVRLGRLNDALPALERAAELRAEWPRYVYVYGVALYTAGRNAEALEVLRDAQKRHPGSREIAALLVQIEGGR